MSGQKVPIRDQSGYRNISAQRLQSFLDLLHCSFSVLLVYILWADTTTLA